MTGIVIDASVTLSWCFPDAEVRERLSAAVEAVDVTTLPALTPSAPRGENCVKP